jgi:prevent-host-death family protein
MEKRVSAAEANRRFSELLRGVRKGRSYVVTWHGKPVAKLIPAEKGEQSFLIARNKLLSRLRRQKATRVIKFRKSWTRDELYRDCR